MALILDVLTSDIPTERVFLWLNNQTLTSDLESSSFLKNDSQLKQSFPVLLLSFIKDQCSRILKLNNVCPHEVNHPEPSPSRGNKSFTDSPSPVALSKNVFNQEPKKTRRIYTQRIDLQSEAAFPPLQSTPKKETPKKRRINPTQLSNSPGEQSRVSPKIGSPRPNNHQTFGNPFNQAKEQVAQNNLDQERALLKQQRHQPISLCVQDVTSTILKTWTCLEPEFGLVSDIQVLERLSDLYAYCLSNNLIPSFFSEIKFVITLMLIRIGSNQNQPHQSYMSSVHNCVYFSVKTLEKLGDIWIHVDPSTMQVLVKNTRLVKFSPLLVEKLCHYLASIPEKNLTSNPPTVGNVSFQSDTDNRFNFASETSFHVFRKQRDQFCEVWQIWKQNSSRAEWKMSISQQKMIQSLVDLKKDCVNYVHLARLFRSQLLNVAQLIDTKEESGPLGLLQNADPEKLRRLKERLVNPPENRSQANVDFEGDQEFFRDFIVLANNPSFNEHLKNSLASGIEELSAIAIASEDCNASAQFSETVISLQVMAKFLAFLTFLPHESADHLPEHIFHDLSRLRSSQPFPIDLFKYVDEALERGRLILILPWVVTYLSLADPVSLCLPSCHPVLCYLVYIFRNKSSGGDLDRQSSFLLKILLSWLFDQTNFPRPLLCKSDDELWSELRPILEKSRRAQVLSPSPDWCLDQFPLVDVSLTYQCCPFLWTWKVLLLDFANADTKWGDRGSASRKITPVSAEDPSLRIKQQTKSLQASLEESFFHNQPASVKRTVDFASDRMASNVVRDVRHRIIPRLALHGQTAVKSWLPEAVKVDEKLDELSGHLCAEVRKETESQTTSAISSLDLIMTSLLPNDLLPQVRIVCIAITTKLTRSKILDWMDRHVTIALFKNDLVAEWNKLDKHAGREVAASPAGDNSHLLTSASSGIHDRSTAPASLLMNELKKLIRDIIRDPSKLATSDVKQMLSKAEGTLTRRTDVTPIAFKCVLQLTFDFILVVCVFQPEIVEAAVIESWTEFWCRMHPAEKSLPQPETETGPAPCSLWLIFAPRQLLLLAQSTSPRRSWDHVTCLIKNLLKTGLVQYREVQEQALAVVRQEWPQELLQRFATCIRDISDWQQEQQKRSDSHRQPSEDEEDGQLLSWLSWFCSQDDL